MNYNDVGDYDVDDPSAIYQPQQHDPKHISYVCNSSAQLSSVSIYPSLEFLPKKSFLIGKLFVSLNIDFQ